MAGASKMVEPFASGFSTVAQFPWAKLLYSAILVFAADYILTSFFSH